MKKKIAVIGVVALVVSLGLFIYNQIIAKAFRYSTPTEAFSNSSQRDSELTDILEDQDVALLIYKKKGLTSVNPLCYYITLLQKILVGGYRCP